MEHEAISVLIVDDSALMRNLIGRIVESAPDLRVAGKAMNGTFALAKLPKLDPDLIILDLEMPEMNGIEFLRERKRLGIEVPVIILSSIASRGAQITMEALALGAADFMMKPAGSGSDDLQNVGNSIIEMIRAYGGKYRQGRKGGPRRPREISSPGIDRARFERPAPIQQAAPVIPKNRPQPLRAPGPVEIIAIGISTGGPNALREAFSKLDPDLKVPILVVQHMPAGFTEEFAKSLDRICPLEVKEAAEGDLVKPGRILIAPGDYHMEVEKRSLAAVVHLNSSDPVNGHRPSVDVLFTSVAKYFSNRAMAVIMTGMGRDGAEKIGDIYREGGITIGQDEASSVVYGMPRVAFENGFIRTQVPLDRIAETICRLVKDPQSL